MIFNFLMLNNESGRDNLVYKAKGPGSRQGQGYRFPIATDHKYLIEG